MTAYRTVSIKSTGLKNFGKFLLSVPYIAEIVDLNSLAYRTYNRNQRVPGNYHWPYFQLWLHSQCWLKGNSR